MKQKGQYRRTVHIIANLDIHESVWFDHAAALEFKLCVGRHWKRQRRWQWQSDGRAFDQNNSNNAYECSSGAGKEPTSKILGWATSDRNIKKKELVVMLFKKNPANKELKNLKQKKVSSTHTLINSFRSTTSRRFDYAAALEDVPKISSWVCPC